MGFLVNDDRELTTALLTIKKRKTKEVRRKNRGRRLVSGAIFKRCC